MIYFPLLNIGWEPPLRLLDILSLSGPAFLQPDRQTSIFIDEKLMVEWSVVEWSVVVECSGGVYHYPAHIIITTS